MAPSPINSTTPRLVYLASNPHPTNQIYETKKGGKPNKPETCGNPVKICTDLYKFASGLTQFCTYRGEEEERKRRAI
jgi:hypothetical protein